MKYEIETPSVPNFVRVKLGSGESVSVSVKDLSEDDIDALGVEWVNALKNAASNLKKRNDAFDKDEVLGKNL